MNGCREQRRRRALPSAALSLVLAGFIAPAAAPAATPAPTKAPAPSWPDDRFRRVAAEALVQELRASLLSENSATATLEHWCAAHRIAADPHIVALVDPGADTPLPPDGRALLSIGSEEPVRFRHVRLACGDRVLSDADNWYVPGRLTPDMNRVLDTTRTPFGKAIASLGFSRATLSSRLNWVPLPPDWFTEASGPPGRGSLSVPDTLIENRALLRDRDGHPLSLVVERYHADVLAFPPPTP